MQIGFGWTNGLSLCLMDEYGGATPRELRRVFLDMFQFNWSWEEPHCPLERNALACPYHLRPLFRFNYFEALDADDEVDYQVDSESTATERAVLRGHSAQDVALPDVLRTSARFSDYLCTTGSCNVPMPPLRDASSRDLFSLSYH